MNIDRSAMQAVAGAASARTPSKATSQDAPEFSFDTGEAPKANAEMRHDAPRAQRADDAHASRPLDHHPKSHETAHDDNTPHTRDTAQGDRAARTPAHAKAHDGANAAAARRGARRDGDADTAADATATDTQSTAATTTSTDAATPPASDTATPADFLPDRMLALLTGDWAAAAPKPTAVAADSASGDAALSALTAAVSRPNAALAATATAATAVTPADPTAGTAITTNAASPIASGAALLQALSMPGADADAASSLPATATPAADAFAALAALAESKSDRGSSGASTDSASSATPSIAFNPLMTKGADAPLAAVRDVIVAMPTAAPLALDADFDDGMSQRITWMADQRLDHAEVRVTPDGLGPIDIRLQMDGHRVNAQFHAAHPDVRQALESGMDRLRDLLGRQGMELGHAEVGAGSRQSGDSRSNGGSAPFGAGTELGGDAQPQVTTVRTLRARGLIDEYA
ncbi:flagellar hook-length control protein FliK [Lysobacter sp. TY2-98]|uniref:flagellar hook-length control protein FliK n=1 Tax=Lysobacter sp. TY2-98 TaxID=2290922 RepID=UPI000E20A57D|nr:flagellar hook-length control protein FliK [Lysobacter sp. TY2-98]AXK71212.1 flagellar hook-length control protein FliK [Lysobacter sp. TY2-98]